MVMSRPELNRSHRKPAKRENGVNGTERFSVSQTKAKLSEVLRLAKEGQAVIVTDHGQDIARIVAITMPDQLSLIMPVNRFVEVRNVLAPTRDQPPIRSALDLLQEDRARR